MNTDLTDERIGEEVRTMLGASQIDVELADDDIKLVAKRALRVLNRYMPFRAYLVLPVTTATKQYRLDDLAAIANANLVFKGVVSVEFIQRRVDPAGVDPFDPYVTSLAGPNYGDETFADVHQRRAYAEEAQRIVSSAPDWRAGWESVDVSGTLETHYYVYIAIERSDVSAGLTFIAGYANTDAGRLMIPDSEVDWFMNWCIMEAKVILGRARGKYGGITNPDGGVDEIDWSQLLTEATEERVTLEEEIRQRKRPYLPVIE